MYRSPFVFRSAGLGVMLLAGLVLGGCDQAGASLHELLTDARIARQAGDLSTSVQLLEEAYELDRDNAEVRFELSNSLMQEKRLNLIDVDRVASHLLAVEDGAATLTASSGVASSSLTKGASCPYASDPNATIFDPTEVAGFPDLSASRETIERVLMITAPLIPDELRTVTACSGIENGELVYDREAARAAFGNQGLSEDQVSSLLAINATARFLRAYLFVTEDVPQQTTWYRLPGDGPRLGICADDVGALREQTDRAVRDLGEALTSVDLRAEISGSTTSRDVVDLVLGSYEVLRDQIGPYCDA